MKRPLLLGSASLALLGLGLYLWAPPAEWGKRAHAGKHKAKHAAPAAPLPRHLKGLKLDKVKWKKKKLSYWSKVLTPKQVYVCRKSGTERAFTGKLLRNKKKGLYLCSSCGHELFSSKAKFRSGTGWPSFYEPYNKASLSSKIDRSYGMVRVEVKCGRCDAHLGHVFNDGPKPTGKRYCINSVCLHFKGKHSAKPAKSAKK